MRKMLHTGVYINLSNPLLRQPLLSTTYSVMSIHVAFPYCPAIAEVKAGAESADNDVGYKLPPFKGAINNSDCSVNNSDN